MTDATTLLALAERAEKATGPDRLLDANIHWQIRRADFEADEDHTEKTYCYARHGWTMNRADYGFLDSIPIPRYTASVDAALMLVRDGWFYEGRQGPSGFPHIWTLSTIKSGDVRYTHTHGRGRSPALAIVAAALRAQAGEGE